jgi:hypothetical protein
MASGARQIMALAPNRQLFAVKLLHTVVWAFFAACIIGVLPFALLGRLRVAGALCAVVFVEVIVLLGNRWRCPLTPIAAQFTDDRKANFDIFLPEWLARYNKEIFGTLYVGELVLVVYLWVRAP